MSLKLYVQWFLIVMVHVVCLPVVASELYVFAGISCVDLEIADVDFNPKLAKAVFGFFVWEGIALELQGDFWTEDDELSDIGLSAEISDFQAGYLRLQSPENGEYSAYVNIGYAEMSILTYPVDQPLSVVEEKLSSPVFILGFQKSLRRYPSFAYSISYEAFYDDDNINMTALTIDYSYKFRFKE